MTEKQKAEIARMRSDGVSYKQISDVLSLSVNTIKSYCKRNNILKTDSEKSLYASCLQCGNPVIQKEKTKRRKFCSDVCRRKWWNAHPEQVNRKAASAAGRSLKPTEITTENIAPMNAT